MPQEYKCVLCGRKLKSDTIHDHYVDEISKLSVDKGYVVIITGKVYNMWLDDFGWAVPDIVLLNEGKLEKVIDVIVTDSYERIKMKCRKIQQFMTPPEVVMFHPVQYTDRVFLPEAKKKWTEILGYEPQSYKQIESYISKKWKEEKLPVTFWYEDQLKKIGNATK